MIGKITVKRGIKRAAGLASVAISPLATLPPGTACILMYHRIAPIDFVDNRADDWNVTVQVFARHMRTLADMADPVPLHALGARLAQPSSSMRPVVCVTVDDGYASALRTALPVLMEYGIPATFFVPTAYVGSREPMPFDRWGALNRGRVTSETWLATDWDELEQAVATDLVTVGSHSHHHFEARDCSAGQLAEEAQRSREHLRARLGSNHARAYAYPYGSSRRGDVTWPYEAAVRAAGYELAVTTDVGLALATGNRFRLPRVEALQLDSPRVLSAKIRGSLTPFWLTDWVRDRIH